MKICYSRLSSVGFALFLALCAASASAANDKINLCAISTDHTTKGSCKTNTIQLWKGDKYRLEYKSSGKSPKVGFYVFDSTTQKELAYIPPSYSGDYTSPAMTDIASRVVYAKVVTKPGHSGIGQIKITRIPCC